MSDVLEKINAVKRASVAARKQRTPLSEIEQRAKAASPVRGFTAALSAKVASGQYALIAEIKKASPSAGLIRDDFSPAALARAYANAGAACLSVLTEEDHFQGDDAHLREARAAVALPVLRKDFMLEPYQIVEARALGADCILLIMAALDDALAAELEDCARAVGLDVLVEVHDEAEMERALKLKSPLIGVNNRNLKTLVTDLATTERLAKALPKDRVLVSESGLKSSADLARMSQCGARRFLVGESLMRQKDVEAATRALLARENAHA
jgi:indole-3-glycerol phosphate synthase